jgi:mono/diheme cytochrome c family protein
MEKYRLLVWIFFAQLPVQTYGADEPASGRSYDPAQLARAEKLYQEHCAFCHGERDKGSVPGGSAAPTAAMCRRPSTGAPMPGITITAQQICRG